MAVALAGIGGCGQRPDALVTRWHLRQRDHKDRMALVVPLDEGRREIWIWSPKSGNGPEKVDILNASPGKVGIVVTYEVEGALGLPQTTYSGRGVPVRPSPGATWVDLDSDGQFDAKYHYETSKGMAIWLDDEWIKATSPEGLANGAILEDGRTVRFDPSKGEWVLTASKGGLPSSME